MTENEAMADYLDALVKSEHQRDADQVKQRSGSVPDRARRFLAIERQHHRRAARAADQALATLDEKPR